MKTDSNFVVNLRRMRAVCVCARVLASHYTYTHHRMSFICYSHVCAMCAYYITLLARRTAAHKRDEPENIKQIQSRALSTVPVVCRPSVEEDFRKGTRRNFDTQVSTFSIRFSIRHFGD